MRLARGRLVGQRVEHSSQRPREDVVVGVDMGE
jgi:hypothetical protein